LNFSKRERPDVSSPSTPSANPAPELDELLRLLTAVSTELWRMRKRMVQPGTNQPRAEMELCFQPLERACDALDDAGLLIRDHTGEPFDSGLALTCLLFQPTEGVDREQVLETVKPTIRYRDRLLQVGEVIVAKPVPPPDSLTPHRGATNEPADDGLRH
jgi:hypothetical protein